MPRRPWPRRLQRRRPGRPGRRRRAGRQVIVLLSLGGGSFAPPSSFDVGAAARFPPGDPDPRTAGAPSACRRRPRLPGRRRPALSRATARSIGRATIPLGVEPDRPGPRRLQRRWHPGHGHRRPPRATRSSCGSARAPGSSCPRRTPRPCRRPRRSSSTGTATGRPTSSTLDQQGQLLLRLGQPGSPGQFEAPQVIGQDLGVTLPRHRPGQDPVRAGPGRARARTSPWSGSSGRPRAPAA